MPWFSNNKSNCSRNRYSITLLYGLMMVYSWFCIYILEVGLLKLRDGRKKIDYPAIVGWSGLTPPRSDIRRFGRAPRSDIGPILGPPRGIFFFGAPDTPSTNFSNGIALSMLPMLRRHRTMLFVCVFWWGVDDIGLERYASFYVLNFDLKAYVTKNQGLIISTKGLNATE